MRVVAKPSARVRRRLIDVGLMVTIKRHRWTTGVNQFWHVVFDAGVDHVPGADRVGAMEKFPRAPDPRNCSGVKYDFLVFAGFKDIVKVSHVTVNATKVH